MDEIRMDPRFHKALLNSLPGETGYKSQRRILQAKLRQNIRDIDSLASVIIFLPGSSIGDTGNQTLHVDNIVDGWIQSNSIDHSLTSLITVISEKSPSGI